MTTVASEAGDGQLLRALHDEHAAPLWSFVSGLLNGDRTRAQDVVQETLLRAWRNPEAIAAAATPRSWLFTVAKRIVIDDWRAARRRPEFITDALPERGRSGRGGTTAAAETADVAEETVTRELVLAALRTLTQQHREVLVECYFRGRSTHETAELLGVPEGTIRSRTHYALHALRRAIEEMGGAA